MKRTKWMTLLSVLLVLCMTVQPVSAAGRGSYNNARKTSSWANYWKDWWNQWEKEEQGTVTEESSSAEETISVMSLLEDETTVENGEMLRASTYNLTTTEAVGTAEERSTKTTLKYFPVTLYDYDQSVINNATHETEIAANADLTQWNGIYFSGGSPAAESYSTGAEKVIPTFDDESAVIKDGDYLLVHKRSNQALQGNDDSIKGKTKWGEATIWNITKNTNADGYYIQNAGTGQYMVISSSSSKVKEDKIAVEIVSYANDNTAIMLKQNGQYLNQTGGSGENYNGWSDGSDMGSVFYLYQITSDNLLSTESLEYAEWNWWNKKTNNNNNGQKTYTGLVKPSLDSNKDIVFTKPEGGIFNSDTTVKDIYTGVEMPFVYDYTTRYYSFDSSQDGVYFRADETQKSTASGIFEPDGTGTLVTPRLYWDNEPQGGAYMNCADGSENLWAPFNTEAITDENAVNYHFGMRATIPFTMTPNGRVVATQDTSDPIKFSFSGDDDVWVFIDGQLVIDLGGIHNRLDAEIDFAANTVTYSESNNIDQETGSFNDSGFALRQTLFRNLIVQDRTTFAATDHHELTIFYLERGKGSSNARIKFNLPVNDTVVVTKDATRSWNSQAEEGENAISPLSETEQAAVNEIPFSFILYRSIDDGVTFEPVANTSYYLLNENKQVIDNPSTAENGQFFLKNGQSAKFITTQMDHTDYDVIYYVHEEAQKGFVDPDYNYSGEAADGFLYKGPEDTDGKKYEKASDIPELEVFDGSGNSGQVTVYGSTESEDSITFLCSNFMDANLPNPGVLPTSDTIVIDYGLPVEIDVLKNDIYRGEKIELIRVNGQGIQFDEETGELSSEGNAPVYGTAQITDEGKIKYILNKQLTGVEVLNYQVKVTGTSENVGGTNTKYKYAVGTVYIVPATTMYYEENFAGLVTYNGKWDEPTVYEAYQNELQEPGVVGTNGDSPYGSDVAYLNDCTDSNGTSRHASTTDGAVQFVYQFTGTGTSFFARTTNTTGYMRIVVTDSDNKTVQSLYRNTRYQDDTNSKTLYNIPVFTTDGLPYGTYKVTVTVAKASETLKYGSDFWLDGIRVMQPLADTDINHSVATTAYATDGEQNMQNVTLRNKLIREADFDKEGNLVWSDGGNFVLFTDTTGKLKTVEQYESIGPKEEVYLNNGQGVSFSLDNWDTNASKIYLGLKAPFGTGTVTIGSQTINVNNATDCYYDISNYAVITTNSDGTKTATFYITSTVNSLISITNIKVTGTSDFTIIQESNSDFDDFEGDGSDTDIEGSDEE